MGIFNLFGGNNQNPVSDQNQANSSTTTTMTTTPISTQRYNGIGTPQNGQSYNGIGNPPTENLNTQSAANNQLTGKPTLVEPVQPTVSVNASIQSDNMGQQPSAPVGSGAVSVSRRDGLDIMTRLTARSNKVLAAANQKAVSLKNPLVDSEHLLFGLLTDLEIVNLLSSIKVIPQEIQKQLEVTFKTGTAPSSPQMAPRVKKILDDALLIGRKLGFEFISPEHILYALYNECEGVGARLLAKMGVNKEELNIKILGKKRGLDEGEEKTIQKSALEKYTVDLTTKAQNGQLDPVVERAPIIERLIHILSRRTKNNPVLTGEAGVGKTAIVEGLAQKIVAKQVPETMLNRRILQLDLIAILAGASHRGEFEERLKSLLEEVKASKSQIILFIDEIHNIVGAGGGEGAGDAANIIKPLLARGELQLIGATTTSEYRKYIEKDPALERRFQTVDVPEPTIEQAIKMLRVLKDKYEAFHKVKIPDNAIEAAVKLSKRYVGGRFLPDKAIDLIDEAASAVRLPIISLPEEIKSLEESIKAVEQEKQESLKADNKVKANILEKRIMDLTDSLKAKQEEFAAKKAQLVGAVSEAMIKEVIARWTGIPVNKIIESEKDKIAHLEEIMHERLINQEKAVASVAQAIRRSRAGLKSPSRPIGSFIFLGPTGVGKTELVKTLAEVLFGTEDSMVRFDMTEYMEKHEVAKLLGAPPGYVGYEEGGKLTEAVKRKPYSVVLFDEVEKAHPDIFNILLQIMDDGRLTDNKGHTISFKNTVVICTSNIGSHSIQQQLLKAGKEQVEEPPTLSSYVVSPRGREIITLGNLLYIKEEGKEKTWQKNFLYDYFAGQKIVEKQSDGSEREVPFAINSVSTHSISPQGAEFVTNGDTLYTRNSTTGKVWTKIKLVDYFKDGVVVNALPDSPEQSLPTAHLSTHSFNSNEEELVTYKNQIWKRKNGTHDWQVQTLSQYLSGVKTESGKIIPSSYWNLHLFKGSVELIAVGESLFIKKADKWEEQKILDYFGEQSPLKAAIEKAKTQEEAVSEHNFVHLKDTVMAELLKFMRPELVNRFDEVIVFEPLKYKHMLSIVKLQIKGLRNLLEEQSYGLQVTEMAQKEIVRVGFDPIYGARPLRRAIQKMVENPISELIIAGKVKEGNTVLVDFDGEKIVFSAIKTEFMERKKELVKQLITCESCSYRFETVVMPESSSVVCARCGKKQSGVPTEQQTKEPVAAQVAKAQNPVPVIQSQASITKAGVNGNGVNRSTNNPQLIAL